MGKQLLDFYEKANQIGGLKAKMRLAVLTNVPSAKAGTEPDSPDNVAKFEKALAQIKSEN
jgi:hypothetical protein